MGCHIENRPQGGIRVFEVSAFSSAYCKKIGWNINRLPSKFTIERERELLPKGVSIKIHKYSIDCGIFLFGYVDSYFKNHTVNVTINYPLKNPYTFTVKCIVLNDLINEIVLAYRRIYEEEKENPGKYGIWGHRIEDLWLEKATLDIETGNIELFVGS